MANSGLLLLLLLAAACKEPVTDNRPTDSTAIDSSSTSNPQGVSVLTQHNDNSRTGWNDNETLLTTSNVDVQHFGKQFALAVDDEVFAQPLVAGKIHIGNGVHNVVYIATANNTLYAYDGDNGRLYWQKNFTAPGMRPPRNSDMAPPTCTPYMDFSGNIGVVGTPVIDAAKTTIYFVSRSTNGSTFVEHLHAVDIVGGTERPGSPVAITATYAGSGDGSVNNVIAFDAQRQNQRQGLSLVNGVVYATFASHCDWGPFHGWILGYDAATLQQRVVYNTTPNGSAGGMWESGTGMAADGQGNLYVVTGNGTVGVSGDPADATNRGESALKLTPSGSTLQVASYFTPSDYQFLNDNDLDYGGMGALLIPNSAYYFTGAKAGVLYLLNKDDMGGFASSDRAHQMIQLSPSANMHCQAAYYKGSAKEFVYVWSENDPLRAIPFDHASGVLDLSGETISVAGAPTGQSGAVLSVSSNGATDGTSIVWASYAFTGDAEHGVTPGILRAFDANDVSKELWNNHQNFSRDGSGSYAKFAAPTIANGHVYLPTFNGQVVVYGLQ